MGFVSPPEWRPVGILDLEPNAWHALRYEGSTCVVAGPGAGKTEFLAQRATYLLQTGLCPPPYRVLAISFKKDAAENLVARVRRRCPPEQARRFLSMTFDAFAKSLVDRFYEAIPSVWRPTRPYEVNFPKERDYRNFLNKVLFSASAAWQTAIAAIQTGSFEKNVVGNWPLPPSKNRPTSGMEFAVQQWWTENLRTLGSSRLTFVMINRLAELILRTNASILRALNMTYPYLFLDEFQDTTYAQYGFLLTAFHGSNVKLTAVGDDKQRIMVWAGARVDAFAKVASDFNAQRIPLLANYRSSNELVRIQHVIAQAMDTGALMAQSRVTNKVSGEVAQIWTFSDEHTEATHMANWLKEDMRERRLSPRDYAILVRQTADIVEAQLAEPFSAVDLSLRNENKAIGKTSLQDLLAEELTLLLMALFRLAIEGRAPAAWALAIRSVASLRAADADNELAWLKAEKETVQFVTNLREFLNANMPTAEIAHSIAERLFTFVDLKVVARTMGHYGLGDNLAIARDAFSKYFMSCAQTSTTWKDCLDAFEGTHQIPLLTIHKSKGLEYDTVIFLGLDDKLWWSHSRRNHEGMATFFVGLSRAKQRVVFTYCRNRGNREKVADLYELLSAAGVPEVGIDSANSGDGADLLAELLGHSR